LQLNILIHDTFAAILFLDYRRNIRSLSICETRNLNILWNIYERYWFTKTHDQKYAIDWSSSLKFMELWFPLDAIALVVDEMHINVLLHFISIKYGKAN